MRASVASLSRKFISVFFAATLALGLVPAAAFAQPEDDAAVAQSSTTADAQVQGNVPGNEGNAGAEGAEGEGDGDLEEDDGSADPSQHVISSEGDEASNPYVISTEPSDSEASGEISSPGDGDDVALPAGEMINQEMELDTVVAQAESTRSFFLAQTLESTRTVPVVSAKLPLDKGANGNVDTSVEDGAPSSEEEGSGSSDDASESDDPVDPSFTLGSSEGDSAAVAAESTVIGSFTYLGMTFAIEPGGESVTLMAVDYSKLPEEFVQKQVLVIPDAATPDGVDYYSVTRIADNALAGLTKDTANPNYVGCEALFADEELLAEAGIDPSEVAGFLSESATTDVAEGGESAGADSQDMPKDEPWAYEDQDQATSDSAIVSSVVDLNDGDAPQNVISSEGDEVPGVEKSRPSDEGEREKDVRAIVSMEGDVATLDDGSTYEFTNPLAGCAGILALGIPASVSAIENDAFTSFDTLQYIIVFEDNPNYSMYDGCLYDKPLSSLLLIPEGRLGAVRIAPSVTSIDPEVFSHCPSVDALVADADSAASQTLENVEFHNADNESIEVIVGDDADVDSTTYDFLSKMNQSIWRLLAFEGFVPKGNTDEFFDTVNRGSFAATPSENVGVLLPNGGVITDHTGGVWPEYYVAEITYGGWRFDQGGYFIDIVDVSNNYYGRLYCQRGEITLAGWEVGWGSLLTEGQCNFVNGALVARWNIPLTVYANGGYWNDDPTWGGYIKTTAVDSRKVSITNSIKRPGYTLVGWSSDQNATSGSWDITAPNEPFSLYAVWQPNSYTVNYWSRDGSTLIASDNGFVYGTARNLAAYPAASVSSGYAGVCWTDGPNNTGQSYGFGSSQSALVTSGSKDLYLAETPIEYGITYTLNGGTNNSGNPSSYTVESDTITLQNPTKPGYTFGGWYSDDGFNTEVTSIPKGSTGDKALYAKWTPTTYTVSLTTERIGAWDAGTPTSLGYTGSWTSADSDKKRTNTYTVESGKSLLVTDASGTSATVNNLVLLPVPSCDYYEFEGWDVTSGDVTLAPYTYNGQRTYGFIVGSAAAHQDISLKARWSEVAYDLTPKMQLDEASARDYVAGTYDIYSDAEGAANPVPFDWKYTVSGTTGDDEKLPNLTAKPGYAFLGWSSPSAILKTESGDVAANADPVKDAMVRANLTSSTPQSYELVARFAIDYFPLVLDTGSADADLNATDASAWKASEGSAYEHAMPNGKEGYTVEVSERTVALPTPTRSGYTFAGWEQTGGQTETAVLFAPEAAGGPWTFQLPETVTDDVLDSYAFTAKWTACPYAIEFGNVAHADGFIAGAIDEGSSTHATKAFDGSALAASASVTVSSPTQMDGDRYTGFTRWVTRNDMSADTVNAWQKGTDEAGDYWHISGFSITRANVEAFFGAGSGTGGAAAVPFPVSAEFALAGYTATLDLAGGTLGGGDAEREWTEGGHAYTCESGEIELPVPTRFGYDLAGWKMACGGAADADADKNDEGAFVIPADSIGDRTYTAQWTGKADHVRFDYNAEYAEGSGDVTVPAGAVEVRYGDAMTAISVMPTRAGYRFAGFFDTAEGTGGKQYYTQALASARAWDKEPIEGGVPHTLYARWSKVDDAATVLIPDYTEADPPTTPPSYTGSTLRIDALDDVGTAQIAFGGHYRGRYTEQPNGRVKVDADSYVLSDTTAQQIYEHFQKGEGDSKRYLLGFRVSSTGSVIAFSDIALGNAFSFEARASELSSGVTAPSASLGPDGIEVLYTSTPFDFGGGAGGAPVDPTPSENDVILALWDANGGAFADGAGSASTETEYVDGATRLRLPAEPTRAGYDFVGWSKAAEHSSDADHTEDATSDMFKPTSIAPCTYHAHWTPRITTVVFDENGSDAAKRTTVAGFAYGMEGTALGSDAVIGKMLPNVPTRTGYAFLGYFDAAEGGVQYYTSSGAQARPWDKEPAAGDAVHTLYAQWTKTSGVTAPPSTPADPEPDDPFPGIPLVPGTVSTIVTAPPDNVASISAALDGAPGSGNAVIAGAYDGKMTYRTDVENAPATYRPAGDDDVAIYLYSYGFDSRDVVSRFEAVAPSATPHLQGFRVKSTQCFVPLSSLDAKETVRIDCKGSDLSASVAPASFTIASDKVEPVYGTTPAIPSHSGDYEWPVDYETQVLNVFDAGVGRFGEGSNVRYMTVPSVYKGQLAVPGPADSPSYSTEQGWSFEGWYAADGTQVADASGNLVGTVIAESATPVTFYAHYTQSRHPIALSLGEAGDYPFAGTAPEAMSAYHGQLVKDVQFPIASTAQDGFSRPGHEFLGWYDAEGKPYYVTDAASAEDKLAYADVRNEPIEANLALTAKWQRITYALSFYYNDDTADDPVYTHKEDDLTGESAIRLAYGDEVPDGLVPEPTDPGYPFLGWYASRDLDFRSAFVSRGSDGDPLDYSASYFQTKEGKRLFMPGTSVPREMSLFAKWDTAGGIPVPYRITIHSGEHGSIGGNLPDPCTLDYRYDDDDILFSDLARDYIVADRGWEPSCWMVKGGSGEYATAMTDRIPTHSTGDVELLMVYAPEDGKYRVELDLGENRPGASLTDGDLAAWSEEADRPLSRAVSVDMQEAVVLPSTFSVPGYNGYSFDGWFRVLPDGTVSNVATASVVPKELIEAAADGQTSFRYVAKWSPQSYSITFRQSATSDASEDVEMEIASYEDEVELPVPATVQNRHIFTNWGATEADRRGTYASWTSGAIIDFAEIAQAVNRLGTGNANCQDMRDNRHVTIYGNWTNALVGADVPLSVNMLIDPYLPEVKVSDAWIGTTSTDPVQVESLTYEAVPDEGAIPGTARMLADSDGRFSAGDFLLTVSAEGGEGPLSLSLGEDATVVSGLASYGFRPFAAGDPLSLSYGLTLPAGVDLTRFAELMSPSLLDATYVDGDGLAQRVSYPLARLYYTIGLVPSA